MKNNLLNKLPAAKWMVTSPGRVNLLGEHVDYNDGMVLPAAIDRYVQMAVSPRDDGIVHVRALDMDAETAFSVKDVTKKIDIEGQQLSKWAVYIAGVCWALQDAGFSPSGMNAVFSSDIPIGAGLSSSAAVELAFAAMWKELGDWRIDRMRLAQICRKAENDYAGVNCGLMDQFACAHGIARHALYFDTRSLAWQPIPLPRGTCIVIADSTLRRELSSSDYNTRKRECEQALALIQQNLPDVQSLRDVSPAMLKSLSAEIPQVLYQRAAHVTEEIERVKQGCQALFSGDAATFGQLMVDSHQSLRDLFAVSIPQLDKLVETACQLPGCFGARLTGAGFGGCTVNLVESGEAEQFCQSLLASYKNAYGLQANAYVCAPSRGVHVDMIK